MKITIDRTELNSDTIYKSNFFMNKKPVITSKINDKYLYTTLIVDPDAPYPSNPTKKYFIHLMVVNSKEIKIDYYPPHPPVDSEAHRYQVILYKQENYIKIKKSEPYPNFDLDGFVKEHNLAFVEKFEFKCKF
jgi:phosphatidylethanolamine-binding protein (PEBP) family uncharacterized protein